MEAAEMTSSERERLDLGSCEALESVLKTLSFRSISLNEATLQENGAAASLLEMIMFYDSAVRLDLSGVGGMEPSAWRSLALLLKQSPRLSHLDLTDVSLVHGPVHGPVQVLSRVLPSSRISELHLDGTGLSGRPLFTLVGALRTNRSLRRLHLNNNRLNSYQDALQLGDLLRFNSTLETLQLRDNLLEDDGLEELCDGLLRQKEEGLKILLLNNNHITERGMEPLARVLPVLKVLQVLDLGQNLLGNEGVLVIRQPLMVNSSLLQLGLKRTNISCEGAVALAEVLAETRTLQVLDLRQNRVKVGGLMALSLALGINRSLVSLELDLKLDLDRDLESSNEDLLPQFCTTHVCG
ncbi:protein phosphatase 1 regulatory subunit 37 [Cololabis saira]|uniref:protein phosphatase 1 regulatory subunit 37 n=1 Tax=Cololabis saira TaxID=129043 RepID=UPI002AD433DA|nr:protein phosphatase 1 regulatory subunit 37 [Cololabis saira]